MRHPFKSWVLPAALLHAPRLTFLFLLCYGQQHYDLQQEFFQSSWCALGVSAFLGGGTRDASEGRGPQRRPQRRLGRRLEEFAQAVGGGYCRLQMPLRLALGRQGDSGWA